VASVTICIALVQRIINTSHVGTLSQTLSGSLQTLTSVDFNESEELLLGSSMDNSTRIWDLTSGRIRVMLRRMDAADSCMI
jgi:WD40 repeat protein